MSDDTSRLCELYDAGCRETDSVPGYSVRRRSLLWLPAYAAVALMLNAPSAPGAARDGEPTGTARADEGRSLSWEDFARAADEEARPVAAGGTSGAYDAYLFALAMRAARLRLDSIPRAKLGAFGGLEPKVSFGVGYRGTAFFVVEWSMEPHAYLPPHCHPNASVCTLGVEGEARIRHFETIGAPADFTSASAFQVRETRTDLISSGRVSTLSPTRDNVHTFRAGSRGARGIDISALHGKSIGFSFLAIEEKPADAEQRIYGAHWTGPAARS